MMVKQERLNQERLAELGEQVALRIPPPNLISVHEPFDYERLVREIECIFGNAISLLQKGDSPEAAILQLGAQSALDFKHNFLHFLGEAIAPCFYEQEVTDKGDLQLVLGYAKWAYIGQICRPVYAQSYPYSLLVYDPKQPCRRFSYATKSIWFKEIPMELRGEYVPEFPEDWELNGMTLYLSDWVYTIRTSFSPIESPLYPAGWEPLLDTSGIWRGARWRSLAESWDLIIW